MEVRCKKLRKDGLVFIIKQWQEYENISELRWVISKTAWKFGRMNNYFFLFSFSVESFYHNFMNSLINEKIAKGLAQNCILKRAACTHTYTRTRTHTHFIFLSRLLTS